MKLPPETAVLSAGLTTLLQLCSQVDNLPRTRRILDDRTSNSGIGIWVYYCTVCVVLFVLYCLYSLLFLKRDRLLSADPVMDLGFGILIC